MGLGISVHCDLEFATALHKVGNRYELVDEDFEVDNEIWIINDDHFLERGDGIQFGLYNGNELMSFHAGSYSGYGDWRNELSELMLGVSSNMAWENREKYKDAQFNELINFSDCEGCIGPETSAKLYKDFKDFDQKAKAHCVDNEVILHDDYSFYGRYKSFMRAFQLASENQGVVCFH